MQYTDNQQEYKHSDILIDQICEWLAQKWTRGMITWKLRDTLDKNLKTRVIKSLIKDAKKRIMERYHIPVEEYKGEHIAFYEFIMRGKSFDKNGAQAKMCDRLRAAERLDALLNLENITNDDPAEQAKKIHAFLRAAEATVGQKTINEEIGASTNEEQSDGDKREKEPEQDDKLARHSENDE